MKVNNGLNWSSKGQRIVTCNPNVGQVQIQLKLSLSKVRDNGIFMF